MTKEEKLILKNQIEVMWVLNLLLGKLLPDLVGRGGELDRMRDDLVRACKNTTACIENRPYDP